MATWRNDEREGSRVGIEDEDASSERRLDKMQDWREAGGERCGARDRDQSHTVACRLASGSPEPSIVRGVSCRVRFPGFSRDPVSM